VFHITGHRVEADAAGIYSSIWDWTVSAMGIYFYSSTGVTECPTVWHSNGEKIYKG
jgi:hypothetical protein